MKFSKVFQLGSRDGACCFKLLLEPLIARSQDAWEPSCDMPSNFACLRRCERSVEKWAQLGRQSDLPRSEALRFAEQDAARTAREAPAPARRTPHQDKKQAKPESCRRAGLG